MTVLTSTNKTIQPGNNATTVWNFSFVIPLASQLFVYFTDSAGTITLLSAITYTATGLGNVNGGSVTYPIGTGLTPTGNAKVQSNETITIERVVPYTQPTTLLNQGAFFAQVVEDAMDNLEYQIQQVQEEIGRTLTLPATASSSISTTLPAPVAGAAFAWSSDGLSIVNVLLVGTVTLSALGQTLINQTTAAAMRTTLGAAASGANTDITSLSAPALGAATATTQAANNNSTKVATTAYVDAAAATGFSTGDVKTTLKTVADSGWVMMNDGTIGSGASGASTRANADTATLYALLWNNCADAQCAVSTGRGANAGADFAANKTIALPKVLGRAIGSAGAGATLTARVLGLAIGEETHLLTVPEIPAHTHVVPSLATSSAVAGGANSGDGSNTTTGSTGGGGAHNNMQPTSFLNFMIKL